MAETQYKFDEKAFNDKRDKLAKLRDEVAGTPNKNPYIWWNNDVQPLSHQFDSGIRTKELFDKMMAIKEEVPDLPARITHFPKKAS